MQGKGEEISLEFTLIDPNGVNYSIHLSPADSPRDLKAYLNDFAPLSIYTNYQFETENRILKDYVELSEQSITEPVIMILNSYNDRTFKHHVKRVKEILSHPPSSFSHVIHNSKDILQEISPEPEKSIPPLSMDSLLLAPNKILNPPSGLCPYSNDEEYLELPQSLLSIAFSEFNPPNNKRKLLGDLGYLVIRTLEGTILHVTCAANGFYVNATDAVKGIFKPEPATEVISGKTLIELLGKASPSFKTAWNKLITITSD